MNSKTIRRLVLVAAFAFAATGPAVAQEFPWEPASPPVYSPPAPTPPASVPTPKQPTHIVPGHKSSYGYVAPYESDGPVVPPPAPGGETRGWVPGHHDAKGAWVPGHPQ
ncbi:MAG: hypothetical protein Q7T44_01970 [Parvibaculum sp.]|nr:hypothetical protein [Parvibaculum sp.]